MSESSPIPCEWRADADASVAALRLGSELGPSPALEWDLKRNCALTPRQLLAFYLSLCAVSLVIAGGFWWVARAGWVMAFAGLELVALGGALALYARHACDRERIRLDRDTLSVTRADGSRNERIDFAAAWVQVKRQPGRDALVELSGQGRRVAVGRFVRLAHRRQLAEELRCALHRSQRAGSAAAV